MRLFTISVFVCVIYFKLKSYKCFDILKWKVLCDTPFKYKSYYYISPTITLSDLPFRWQFEAGMSE